MADMEIVLASASPRRQELLRQIGFDPVIMPSGVDETVTNTVPSQVVEILSERKAGDVAARYFKEGKKGEKTGLVIGSDTVVSVDGLILGKPKDAGDAVRMIGLLKGRVHQVYTGVTIQSRSRKITFSVETKVSVYPMSLGEIEAYVACGESMDKAGAYGIQGRFAAFIKEIEGSYTNVMGLPVGRVYQELKNFEEAWHDKTDSVGY